MSVQPGDVFAGYRIVRRIGAGGMGAVYLAEHPRLPRRDALKILDPGLGADAEFRARFEREAELAARLEHPNVVSIYDRGAEGDLLWIAMRYVDGVDAAELVRRGPAVLPAGRAVRIVAPAARGLEPRPPPATRRYTYGYGRAEDLAGLFVVAMIALSAL
uniref:protein kinase domain-containing protein n=1 Tax=Nocardia asiatica TaxID=209252 RepID=UPI002455ABE6